VLLYLEDNSAEMAKLYGNKSAAFYQIALLGEAEEGCSDDVSECLQQALKDGLKSVELDPSYEKGHFRLVSGATHRLSYMTFVCHLSGNCSLLLSHSCRPLIPMLVNLVFD